MRGAAGTSLVLLLLASAAAVAPARLIMDAAKLKSPLAQLTALFTLPKEQLAMGVPDSDFLAVLTHALACMDALVQDKIDKRDTLFLLAVNVTSKVLDGPQDFLLQGLGNSFVVKYPAVIPNLTAAFPAFNITDFPTMPWLNQSITIKGLPTFDVLNWSMRLLTPQIPILNSKIILTNDFKQATLQLNTTKDKT
jgi:hypothetical protein